MLSTFYELIKMKFQIVALITLLLTAVTPAYSASIFFTPTGAQLDSDPIKDFETEAGLKNFQLNIFVDTTGLSANLTSLEFGTNRDFTELVIASSPNVAPDVFNTSIVRADNSVTGVSNITVTLTAVAGGLSPNSILNFVDGVYDVPNLRNDGLSDFEITGVTSAFDANGTNVTSLFASSAQTFEVQPVPEPTSTLGLLAFAAFVAFKRKRKA